MKAIITLAILLILHFRGSASELFIRVNTTGEYYVTVYDQTIYNRSNVFKFFDLPSGITTVLVRHQYTNTILYNGTLSLKHNERIIAEINQFGNLAIIQKSLIQEINWYTSYPMNDPYIGNPYPGGPYPGTPYPGNPYPGNNHPYPGNNSAYLQFLSSFKSESMDSNKLKMAKNYASSNALTAEQIATISKGFSFDSNRLEFAKHAYATCYDKNNYFMLKDTFSFSSNYNALLKHIEGK